MRKRVVILVVAGLIASTLIGVNFFSFKKPAPVNQPSQKTLQLLSSTSTGLTGSGAMVNDMYSGDTHSDHGMDVYDRFKSERVAKFGKIVTDTVFDIFSVPEISRDLDVLKVVGNKVYIADRGLNKISLFEWK